MKQLPFNIDLSGKTAIVTGGGGVLCSGFAKTIAACGANVAILDLKEEAAKKVADEINADGGVALGIATNVLSKESLEEAKKVILEKFGRRSFSNLPLFGLKNAGSLFMEVTTTVNDSPHQASLLLPRGDLY